MSFPSNPTYKQKHTDSQGNDFYWIGKWVKPGAVTSMNVTHDVKDPDATEGHEYGSRWVNLESGESFEFAAPGIWSVICHEPSIQISPVEPKTQSSGATLVDGDMWFDPVTVTIGIYHNKKWFDVIGSATTGTVTEKTSGKP